MKAWNARPAAPRDPGPMPILRHQVSGTAEKGPRRRTGRAFAPLPVHPRSGRLLGLPRARVCSFPNSRLIEPTIGDRLVCQRGGLPVVLPRRSQRPPPQSRRRALYLGECHCQIELVGRIVAVAYDLRGGAWDSFVASRLHPRRPHGRALLGVERAARQLACRTSSGGAALVDPSVGQRRRAGRPRSVAPPIVPLGVASDR
jgi:hypothetical protein